MKKLRIMCEQMGYRNVKTYINSGNVIFDSEQKSSTIEKEIKS